MNNTISLNLQQSILILARYIVLRFQKEQINAQMGLVGES